MGLMTPSISSVETVSALGDRDQRERQREADQDTAGDRLAPPTANHRSGCIIARHGAPPPARARRSRPLRLGPGPIRSIAPITTASGACRSTTTAGSSSSCASRAPRPGSRGSRSSGSAPATGAPSTASTRGRWPRYRAAKIRALLADPGIVRNRLKVERRVQNARAFLALREELGSFDRFLWELRRGRAAPERPAEPEGRPAAHAGVGRAQPGAPEARLHVRRLDDLLRLHAVRRPGERSRRRLLPPPRGGPARRRRPGVGATEISEADPRDPKGAAMSTSGRSSIVGASVWMLVISLLLFWLPFVGPLLGGVIGGRKAGGVVRAILAALVPAFVVGVLLFVLATLLTGMPLIGAVAAAGGFVAGRGAGGADDPRRDPRRPDGLIGRRRPGPRRTMRRRRGSREPSAAAPSVAAQAARRDPDGDGVGAGEGLGRHADPAHALAVLGHVLPAPGLPAARRGRGAPRRSRSRCRRPCRRRRDGAPRAGGVAMFRSFGVSGWL